MNKPRTIQGRTYQKGNYFYSQNICFLSPSSFKESTFVGGNWKLEIGPPMADLTNYQLLITSYRLLGGILPLYMMGGRTGASHGGDLLSASQKLYIGD